MAECKVGQILRELDSSEEYVALTKALWDKHLWSSKALADAVSKTRFSLGATTVKEHRRRKCGCFT